MQEQINSLQAQIDQIRRDLTNRDMSIELRSNIQNEVVKDAKGGTQTTTVTINSLGDQVTFPKISNASLIIKWKGKEYTIPAYV